MSNDTNSPDAMLEEYDKLSIVYGDFTTRLQALITEIVRSEGIKPHSITGRLKSRTSLEEKISRPGKSYSQLADVTDISGVRVITYFPADVDHVAALLEKEFKLHPEDSVDKRIYQDADRFGYKSLHYVVSLTPDRAKLLEYAPFSGLKAEIQVRTVIQHAWAEIEHDLGYKNPTAVPKAAKRKLFRLAALLELADEEFTAVKETLTKRTSQVRANFQRGEFDVDIDSTSLAELVTSDPLISDSDKEIARRANLIFDADRSLGSDALATWLRYVGITTIQQVRSLFAKKQQLIVDLASNRLKGSRIPVQRGLAILYACYVVLAEKGNTEAILNFLQDNKFGFDHQDRQNSAARMMEAYSNIRTAS